MKDLYIEQLAASTLRFDTKTILLNDSEFIKSKKIEARNIKNISTVLIFKDSPNDMTLSGLPEGTEGQIVIIVNLTDYKLALDSSKSSEEDTELLATKFCTPNGNFFDINSKYSAMFMYRESLFGHKRDKPIEEKIMTGGWLLLDFQGESKNQTQ